MCNTVDILDYFQRFQDPTGTACQRTRLRSAPSHSAGRTNNCAMSSKKGNSPCFRVRRRPADPHQHSDLHASSDVHPFRASLERCTFNSAHRQNVTHLADQSCHTCLSLSYPNWSKERAKMHSLAILPASSAGSRVSYVHDLHKVNGKNAMAPRTG